MNSYNSNRTQAVLRLKKGLPVWSNFSSRDCDGCSSQSSERVESVEHLIQMEKGFNDSLAWADGPMNMWFVFDKSDTLETMSGGCW